MTASPVSVVIADDQAAVREGLIAVFATVEGITVIGVAQDGDGAVALAERYDADAVLMDLQMPGTGGLEATRLLAERRPRTAVVILSTYADDAAVAAAFAAGASAFLTKRASPDDIGSAVRAAVSARRPNRPPER